MEASITFKSIAKSFQNKHLLADLSFGVEKGTTFVLIGENGSGKSVILKLLVGLLEKDAGVAYINGKDVHSRALECRSFTGYMGQLIDLDDTISIKENLIIYARLHGMRHKDAKDKVDHWSGILGFYEWLNCMPDTISYGNKRKVMFARAIIHNPDVIVLDEPTKGLDPHSSKKIWEVLDKLHSNKTILFTTQNFEEAERYADRIAILHNGNIKMNGTLDRLIETTEGLTRYRLTFDDIPSDDFIKELESYPKIIKPELTGLDLEFYSREKKYFFYVLKRALEYNLSDMDNSICRLRDLFIGLTDGGLE